MRIVFSALYTDNQPTDNQTPIFDMENDEDAELLPLRSEVEAASRELKNGKACGVDEIPAELLRAAGQECVTLLYSLCVKIWRTGECPVDWVRTREDGQSLYHCRRKGIYNSAATIGPSPSNATPAKLC